MSVCRLAQGIVSSCINPVLCNIVDKRHDSCYGVINGLYAAAYNSGFFVGMQSILPRFPNVLLSIIPMQLYEYYLFLLDTVIP